MTVFFGIFAWVCSGLLVLGGVLGYGHGPLGIEAGTHLLVGLGAVIASISLHCLVFGIFTGSGKDTRELVQDLRLDSTYAARTKAFRKHVFPAALNSIFLLIVGAALGGALGAYSASSIVRWSHGLFMLWAFAYNVRSFRIEYKAVAENARILASLNLVAAASLKGVPSRKVEEGEPELLGATIEPLEWGTHVFALGKFFCFLGFNAWLPYVYFKYIVGYFTLPVWPFLAASSVLWAAGYGIRWRYRAYRPGSSRRPPADLTAPVV